MWLHVLDADGAPTGEMKWDAGVFVRSPYNYDMNAASDASGLFCPEPTLTQQQFREDSDINTIVERFGLTGQLPSDVKVPMEGDFADVVDFQSALNIVRASEEAFMEMPASVRERFDNNPGKLLAFVHDPANRAEAEKLGIVVPRETPKVPDPVLVRVVPEVSGGGTSST